MIRFTIHAKQLVERGKMERLKEETDCCGNCLLSPPLCQVQPLQWVPSSCMAAEGRNEDESNTYCICCVQYLEQAPSHLILNKEVNLERRSWLWSIWSILEARASKFSKRDPWFFLNLRLISLEVSFWAYSQLLDADLPSRTWKSSLLAWEL